MKIENDYTKYFSLIENLDIQAVKNSISVTRDMAYKYRRGESIPPLKKAIKLEDEFKIPLRAWVYFSDYKVKESTSV